MTDHSIDTVARTRLQVVINSISARQTLLLNSPWPPIERRPLCNKGKFGQGARHHDAANSVGPRRWGDPM